MIPKWHHAGMSKQIAVRLPDDLVDFIDQLIDRGDATSRAVVVARAVAKERRREIAARATRPSWLRSATTLISTAWRSTWRARPWTTSTDPPSGEAAPHGG